MKYLLILISIGLFTVRTHAQDWKKIEDPRERAMFLMEGSYDSFDQYKNDTANYLFISLHMYSIWHDRNDGPWLYVEQAVASYPDKPYRQRIYRLRKLGTDSLVSEIYTLKDPQRAVLCWKHLNPLQHLTPDSIDLKKGCEVYLKIKGDGTFSGKTRQQTCPSELRGALFATSEVNITEGRLISWDRGFDSVGVQAWGATKGGYKFKKRGNHLLNIVGAETWEKYSRKRKEAEAVFHKIESARKQLRSLLDNGQIMKEKFQIETLRLKMLEDEHNRTLKILEHEAFEFDALAKKHPDWNFTYMKRVVRERLINTGIL